MLKKFRTITEETLNELSVEKLTGYIRRAGTKQQKLEAGLRKATEKGEGQKELPNFFRKTGNLAVGVKLADKKLYKKGATASASSEGMSLGYSDLGSEETLQEREAPNDTIADHDRKAQWHYKNAGVVNKDGSIRRGKQRMGTFKHAALHQYKSAMKKLGVYEDEIVEVAPPGREKQVKALKKKFGKKSAFKIAWSSYEKGKKK